MAVHDVSVGPATEVSTERSATILVVEDLEPLREITARLLVRAGYDVLVATGGDHAIALASAHGGTIDLLLSDVIMPGMLGPHLAQLLRQIIPDIRVIFTSGAAEPAADEEPEMIGPVLQKPVFATVLLERIASALGAV